MNSFKLRHSLSKPMAGFPFSRSTQTLLLRKSFSPPAVHNFAFQQCYGFRSNVRICYSSSSWLSQHARNERVNNKHMRRRADKLVLRKPSEHQKFEGVVRQITNEKVMPHNWYPRARAIKRKIILHVGPTNSGKTHNAIKALENVKGNGVYLGPLRLLASEVRDTLAQRNIGCNLITGQERIVDLNAKITASTVEMLDSSQAYDVAVIDEIQLIQDTNRGWAWSRALLSLCADEIHLCGEDGSVDLIAEICNHTGDELLIHRYDRLNALEASHERMSSKNIRIGDCVVAFSRRDIYSIKHAIETSSNHKCSVIYGNLPPETRKEQARLFNDTESDYSVLVASDAIGMGMNLNIERIIFSTLEKFDGERQRPLTDSEIKQIGGRAGRFSTHSNLKPGIVCGSNGEAHERISRALEAPSRMLKKAIVFPPKNHIYNSIVQRVKRSLGGEVWARLEEDLKDPFRDKKKLNKKMKKRFERYERNAIVGRILNRAFQQILEEVSSLDTDSLYEVTDSSERIDLLKRLEDIPLGFSNLQMLSMAPVNADNEFCVAALRLYAENYADAEANTLHELGLLPERFHGCLKPKLYLKAPYESSSTPQLPIVYMNDNVPTVQADLLDCEAVYNVLDLSLWLSWKFNHTEEQREEIEKERNNCADLIAKGIKVVEAERRNDRRNRREYRASKSR